MFKSSKQYAISGHDRRLCCCATFLYRLFGSSNLGIFVNGQWGLKANSMNLDLKKIIMSFGWNTKEIWLSKPGYEIWQIACPTITFTFKSQSHFYTISCLLSPLCLGFGLLKFLLKLNDKTEVFLNDLNPHAWSFYQQYPHKTMICFCHIKPLHGSSKDPSLDLTFRHMQWVTKPYAWWFNIIMGIIHTHHESKEKR